MTACTTPSHPQDPRPGKRAPRHRRIAIHADRNVPHKITHMPPEVECAPHGPLFHELLRQGNAPCPLPARFHACPAQRLADQLPVMRVPPPTHTEKPQPHAPRWRILGADKHDVHRLPRLRSVQHLVVEARACRERNQMTVHSDPERRVLDDKRPVGRVDGLHRRDWIVKKFRVQPQRIKTGEHDRRGARGIPAFGTLLLRAGLPHPLARAPPICRKSR